MKTIITSIIILTSLISHRQNPILEDLWKRYQIRDFDGVIDQSKKSCQECFDLKATKNATQ